MRSRIPIAIIMVLLWCGLNSFSVNAQQAVRQSGFLKHEVYLNIPGVSVFDLFGSTKFPGSPDESNFLTAFDTRTVYADDSHDNFGARITGWITPTETGEYEFFLRSDDGAELQLSTDDNPANLQFIAEETDCCDAFLEASTGDLATSLPINLRAGQSYAIQVVQKEGGGGDYAQVAWRKVGDSTAAAALTPIPGAFLSTAIVPKGSITVDRQPANATVQEGRKGKFSVGITTTHGPVLVQWQLNGSNIAGAVGESVEIGPVSLADSGTKIKAQISIPGATATTAEVAMAVVPDTFPPVPSAGALLKNGNQEVGITFDEAVDAANLGAAANYTASAGTIQSVNVVTRSLANFSPDIPFEVPEFAAVKVVVSGLTPGQQYSIGVNNIKDLKGNTITSPVNAPFTAEGSLTWNVVGASEAGFVDDAIRVGDDGFDIVSGGVAFWADYDEITFVNQEISGDFDKVVQLEYQDPSSQWARTGLLAREALDEGKGRPPRADCTAAVIDDGTPAGEACVPAELRFSRTQTVHANAAIRFDAGVSNNAYENNYRNSDTLTAGFGNQMNGANGGGGPLNYPNVWMRLARAGDTLMTYRSTDGENWTIMTTREFPALAKTLFVGPFYAPELNNNDTTAKLGHSVLAKFRNYRNFGEAPPTGGGGAGKINTDGLVAYWNFDGNLNDSIKTFHGTSRGATPVAFEDGKGGFGKAIRLTGANFVEITGGNNKELQFPAGSMSIAGWFKVGTFDKSWQALISKGEGTNYRVARRSAEASLAYAGGVGEGTNDAPDVNDGNWHHFVAVSDAAVTEFGTALYIDGKRYEVNATKPVLADNNLNLMIGENPGALNRQWNGWIDDISIWGRVITAAEVTTLYSAGARLPLSSFVVSGGSLGVARTATGITITYDGTLQSADSVTGPWTNVAGATSPAAIQFSGAGKFYRSRK